MHTTGIQPFSDEHTSPNTEVRNDVTDIPLSSNV